MLATLDQTSWMLCRVFYEDSASPSSNIETGAGEALKRDTSDRDG